MRLIDADALSKKWQEVLDEKADEKGTVAYITFELFIDRLKEEPTIEAEPVRQGRWEDSTDEWLGTDVYTCSKCRESYVLVEGTPKENLWHYCPNCGAKMESEE